MEKSSDYLRQSSEEILEDIDSRDPKYGLAWKDPVGTPLNYLDAKLCQKAHGISYILSNGQKETRKEFLEELLRDLIGYGLMVHYRVAKGIE